MASCLIGVGANLGDPAATLRAAVQRLQAEPRLSRLVASTWHRTTAIGGPPGQPGFLNGAVRFETDLSPLALLRLLQAIEQEFGRQRGETWGPRTLDLDLLLYDAETLTTPELVLPHPRLAFRRFVLAPAVEIAADWVHPPTQLTLSQLWTLVNSAPRYVALASACWFARQYVARGATAALKTAGVDIHQAETRGMSVFGAPPIADPEHSSVEHYCELVPRLARSIEQPLAEFPQRWLIGGFWVEEIRLGARLWFTGEARRMAEQAASEAFASTPAPRLLMVLRTPDDLLLLNPHAIGQDEAYYDQARRLVAQRDALEQHAAAYREVPQLPLSAAAPEAALRELIAAIEAMAPTT